MAVSPNASDHAHALSGASVADAGSAYSRARPAPRGGRRDRRIRTQGLRSRRKPRRSRPRQARRPRRASRGRPPDDRVGGFHHHEMAHLMLGQELRRPLERARRRARSRAPMLAMAPTFTSSRSWPAAAVRSRSETTTPGPLALEIEHDDAVNAVRGHHARRLAQRGLGGAADHAEAHRVEHLRLPELGGEEAVLEGLECRSARSHGAKLRRRARRGIGASRRSRSVVHTDTRRRGAAILVRHARGSHGESSVDAAHGALGAGRHCGRCSGSTSGFPASPGWTRRGAGSRAATRLGSWLPPSWSSAPTGVTSCCSGDLRPARLGASAGARATSSRWPGWRPRESSPRRAPAASPSRAGRCRAPACPAARSYTG